jgi:FtsP/CotA-like multicopper oxidase with cupredoxin domain
MPVLRRFAAVLIALACLAGCRSSAQVNPPLSGSQAAPQQTPDTNVNELPEPPVVKSVNGVAKLKLQVTFSGATGFPQFVYKGLGNNAPTIRVNPGDRIEMTVENELLPRKGEKDDINIHFHGMGSTPNPPGDDVLGTLAKPGQTLHYVVHVPKNQEPGLYWYHPHVHGQTTYQVGSGGMSGAIIVNGLEHHIPGLAKMKERMIIVRSTGVGKSAPPCCGDDDEPSSMSDMSDMNGMSSMASPTSNPGVINSEPCGADLGFSTLLNGAYQPVITIAPGEKQFFRVVNATGHKTLKLSTGSDLVLVAIDGFALDTWPGTPATETMKSIIIPPASRAEFVVTGPRNGFGTFKTLCYDTGFTGDRDPELLLAKLRAPKGGSKTSSFTGPLTVGAPLPQNVYTTALPPPAAKRVVIFSEGRTHFFLNGKAFHMSDPPMFTVHVRTVEEWRLVNVTQETHDFHLHQAHFLIKQIDGVRLAHPYWADSVVLPHRRKDGKPGTMVIIADFRDPVIKGTFLFHCHILDHEDAGMMAKIQAI